MNRFIDSNLVFSLVIIATLLAGCAEDESETDDMPDFNAEHIMQVRRDKDKLFRDPNESPLPNDVRATFKSLLYFPPNENYFLPAAFEPFDNPDTITILTNSLSETRKMLRYGRFSFSIGDSTYFLFAFKSLEASDHILFVPFNDASNGVKTYAAGRYLDIEEEPDANEYILDFNLAYNPYCAYSDRYVCPRVPRENQLSVQILAGEKTYH